MASAIFFNAAAVSASKITMSIESLGVKDSDLKSVGAAVLKRGVLAASVTRGFKLGVRNFALDPFLGCGL